MDYRQIAQEFENVKNIEALENLFQKYLGKQWLLANEFKKMGTLNPEEKKEFGKNLSDAKKLLTEVYEDRLNIFNIEQINQSLNKDLVDFSLEKPDIELWHFSLLAKVRREAEEVCKSMWFIIEYGTEVVTKFENFESVNIPLTHPATDMQDTIHLKEEDHRGESLIFRAHTSAMQNLLIKKYWVPLKAVIPGKVYRYENVDATHDTMFYQLEWLIVDKGLTIANFKHTMDILLSAILQKQVETRMRPGYFPFVEPGFELDISCLICGGEGCPSCKHSGWLELCPCGMIHPNVLREGGIDPDEYTGFAFGLGLTRLAMMKYGIKDIRDLNAGSLTDLSQFTDDK